MTNFVESHQIEQLIAGDEQAFELIYHVYSQKVYRLAFRYVKDRSQSEEIVQETFIKLWLCKDGLDAEGNMWSYLSIIAKRLSLNALREVVKSATLTEKLILKIEEAYNHTEEHIYANDLEQITENLINNLPGQQQLIFKLSRIEGLSHKEIAHQLNISPNTVKNHMVQALKTLKAKLDFTGLIYFIIIFFSTSRTH